MANVPISETGTASNGMSVARQPCRKMKTTSMTSASACQQSLDDFANAFGDRLRGVERDGVIQIRRKAFLQFRHELV